MAIILMYLYLVNSFLPGYSLLEKNLTKTGKSLKKSFPLIIESKNWQSADFQKIADRFYSAQILVIGENHNDEKGHLLIKKLLKFLHAKYKIGLSMEMLELDQKLVLKEYLLDFLDDRRFRSFANLPKNYRKQYEPIIKAAKNAKIPVIAANVPRRYANLVARKGLAALKKLPEESFKYLPPLAAILPPEGDANKKYEQKLKTLLKKHKLKKRKIENMIMAHYLWDASMAFNVASFLKENPKIKIVHINGRFHSDYYYGVVHRLKKMGLKVLTISIFPLGENDKISERMQALADFVIISGIKKKSAPKAHQHGRIKNLRPN